MNINPGVYHFRLDGFIGFDRLKNPIWEDWIKKDIIEVTWNNGLQRVTHVSSREYGKMTIEDYQKQKETSFTVHLVLATQAA